MWNNKGMLLFWIFFLDDGTIGLWMMYLFVFVCSLCDYDHFPITLLWFFGFYILMIELKIGALCFDYSQSGYSILKH